LSDPSARGTAYTKDYQFTGSAVSVLSPKLFNEVRFQASTRRALSHAGDTAGPGVEIAGLARFGRSYDADGARHETRQQFVDIVSLIRSRSEWKFGATANHVSLSDDARDGFGGLYIFRTVDDFAAGHPAVWRQAFGDSRTRFGVTNFGGFLQNQWRVTQGLTLNLGARYDVERLPTPFRTDPNNFSPRLGLAWSPAKEWVVRTGFGIYYDRLPLAFLNRAVQKDGTQSFEQVATDVEAARLLVYNGARLRDAGLPFVTAPNKFTVQGAHDALVQLSATLRTLAVSLYKIANDIRLMSCGPRAGFAELSIPENEPGSSIMPGKVNPTQCEALTMIAAQVMGNDVAVGFGGAGGYLEMNVYKPLIIFNVTHSITIMTDGCVNFRKFLVEGTKPNLDKIKEYVDRSLMLVTALAPVIGYDKASKIAHYAMDNDLTLKAAALELGFVTEAEFQRVVDPARMVTPYVATGT